MFLLKSLFRSTLSSRSSFSTYSTSSSQSLAGSEDDKYPFPTNVKQVRKTKKRGHPDYLPEPSAGVREVRYFLYTLLTSDRHNCATEYPEWVLETCMGFNGNGNDLRNMSEQQLRLLCPMTAVATGIEATNHKPGLFVPPRARSMIGQVISAHITAKKRQETQAQDTHRGWYESEEKLRRRDMAMKSAVRTNYAQSMFEMPAPIQQPPSPAASMYLQSASVQPAVHGPMYPASTSFDMYVPNLSRTSTTARYAPYSSSRSMHASSNTLPERSDPHRSPITSTKSLSYRQSYRPQRHSSLRASSTTTAGKTDCRTLNPHYINGACKSSPDYSRHLMYGRTLNNPHRRPSLRPQPSFSVPERISEELDGQREPDILFRERYDSVYGNVLYTMPAYYGHAASTPDPSDPRLAAAIGTGSLAVPGLESVPKQASNPVLSPVAKVEGKLRIASQMARTAPSEIGQNDSFADIANTKSEVKTVVSVMNRPRPKRMEEFGEDVREPKTDTLLAPLVAELAVLRHQRTSEIVRTVQAQREWTEDAMRYEPVAPHVQTQQVEYQGHTGHSLRPRQSPR